jgi:hypothetical protein
MHGKKTLMHSLKFIVVPNENHVPKDNREIAVSQKIKLLHTLLEECLDMEQEKLQVHPYGEYYENV